MAVLIFLSAGFVIVVLSLLVKYTREMRDLLREYRLEIKELNANVKTLKRRLNEITAARSETGCNE
ncbi:MAG: hypothetical protein SWN10_22635 [Pseudomonadota bacterium]|uniref:Uncharacterized protein n=1 Tax=Alteromonas alba TaxID=2079529 RepID=A0A2S9V6X0_9ALTE|nr:hypothetical protein [Alteromonas alba]MDY6929876.1 hypothetical protein [Pseudomonadota bacterium]PRO72192.1 hypothetical protein C6Y40_18625 [Alteromonas alba]|tara:strand:- start:7067 stop:7264 length:198 start_codon:yes stop_codon:yes gene_type:complete